MKYKMNEGWKCSGSTLEDARMRAVGSMGGQLFMESWEVVIDKRLYSGKINSDAAAVCREVNVVLNRIEDRSHLNEDEHFDVKVILNELLQNAIRHGNGMDCDKMIALDVSIDALDTLEISVQDEGPGFDVERMIELKREKALDCDDVFCMDESGRGLLIIENLCDTVLRNASGNCVTVRKQIHVC